MPLGPSLLMCLLKGADTIDEAVGQFYENPDKYSQAPVPTANMSKSADNPTDAKMQAPPESPPQYTPAVATRSRIGYQKNHRPHTNQVIEAGNVRARDEVCFILASPPVAARG